METLEASRVCRLCGNHSGISINIFDKKENHVRKINAVLPIMVHEMDLLPKHMCHRCSYKLEEFHKFYIDCLKTDANLKSQLSWMRKEGSKEKTGVPMVHIENIKIKTEPPDYDDLYDLESIDRLHEKPNSTVHTVNMDYISAMNSINFPMNGVQANEIATTTTTYATTYGSWECCCDKNKDQSSNNNSNSNKRSMTISNDYHRGSLLSDRQSKKGDDFDNNNTSSNSSSSSSTFRNLLSPSSSSLLVSRYYKNKNTAKDEDQSTNNNSGDGGSSSSSSSSSCNNNGQTTVTNPPNFPVRRKSLLRDCNNKVRKKTYNVDEHSTSLLVRNLKLKKCPVENSFDIEKSYTTNSSSNSSKNTVDVSDNKAKPPILDEIKTENKVNSDQSMINEKRRTLRPRTKVIDYLNVRRRTKCVEKSVVKRDIEKLDDVDKKKPNVKRQKLECTIKTEKDIEHNIKEEISDNLENVNRVNAPIYPSRRSNFLTGKRPKKVSIAKENVNTKPSHLQNKNIFQVIKELKLIKKLSNGKVKSTKTIYSAKSLRSHDSYLRNGKIISTSEVGAKVGTKRLQRNSRYNKDNSNNNNNYNGSNSNSNSNNTGARKYIDENTSSAKKISSMSLSLPVTNNSIKYHCEKCSLSFFNKKLFKLHACYD